MSAREQIPALLTLQSSDGEKVNIDYLAAKQSILIRDLIVGIDIPTAILVPGVNGPTLQKVIEWCDYHKNDPPHDNSNNSREGTDDIDVWDEEFMHVDHEIIFDIIWAADYLKIRPLIDLCCKTIANMIKDKAPREIRQLFSIPSSFILDEEEEIRQLFSS